MLAATPLEQKEVSHEDRATVPPTRGWKSMSVIMTFRVEGDPRKLEELAADDPEKLPAIAERAKEAGIIAHRFYGSDDGWIMVVDEWPDEQSFLSFFESQRSEIEPAMAEVGVSGEPEIRFWRKLATNDDIAWDA
jgi:hypothetical protein